MKSFVLLYSLYMLCSIVFLEKNHNNLITVNNIEASLEAEKDTLDDINVNSEILDSDITDDELILFFENVYLDLRYPQLAQSVDEIYMQGWNHLDSDYKDKDQMKNYFLTFMNEETFDYLYQIFDYQIYNKHVIYNKELELSNYIVDFERRDEFEIISKEDHSYKLKVPFKYYGFNDVEPKLDFGEVWIEEDSSGELKIVKISQWLNDLICYEFKEYKYIYFINSEEHYQEFLDKYGKNNKGESISTEIIRNGEYILPDSDSRLLTEADLGPLTKISAVLAYYEIEARHGYVSEFQDSFISCDFYFMYCCSWFSRSGDKNHLSEIEKNNQEILLDYIESF